MSEIKRYSVVAEQATNGYLGTVEIESSNGKYYRVVDVKLILENRRTPSVSAETVRELVNTLKQYADPSNWRMNSWTDSNSSNFDGMGPAIKALSRAEAELKGTK